MSDLIKQHNLKQTFVYLDNITIAGADVDDHDKELRKLLCKLKLHKLTLNTSKTILRQKHLRLLGYELTHNQIRPDPERTAPLMSFPIPQDKKHLERLLGMFAYYSKFIPSYSEKVSILCKTSRFPLDQEARKLLLS